MTPPHQPIPRPAVTGEPEIRFYECAERYLDGALRLNPTASTYYGYHKYDGDLEEFSPEALGDRVAFYESALRDFSRLEREPLAPATAIDLDLIRNDAESNIFMLRDLKSHENDPSLYNDILGYGWLFLTLLEDGDPGWSERLESLLSRMRRIPGFLSDARRNLKRPARVLTSFVAEQNRGHIDFFQRSLPELAARAPGLRAELETEGRRVLEAIEEYQEFLEGELLARSTGDWRLGKDLWTGKLNYTLQSDMEPEEILERAWARLKSERQEMLRLAEPIHDSLFPDHRHGEKGEDRINVVVPEVIGAVSSRHSTPENLLSDVRDKWVPRARAFVRKAGLLTLPPDSDNFVVERTPGFLDGRAVAFFSPPPAFEPHLKKSYWISSIPATGDAEKDKERTESFLREYNDYGLQSLTCHEALPGHYVQFYYALNSPYASIYKKIFANSTFAEGWAVFSEEQMFRAGYADGEPEKTLIHKKMNLRGPLNAILDARLHTEPMPEEATDRWALDLMQRFGFQESAEAAGKLRRAKVTSTQLSTYFVGYLELTDLAEAYRSAKGTGFSLREFNERLLSYGTIPPRAIRRLMLDGDAAR
jgi:uncharacterized protein (DUF885 family)